MRDLEDGLAKRPPGCSQSCGSERMGGRKGWLSKSTWPQGRQMPFCYTDATSRCDPCAEGDFL